MLDKTKAIEIFEEVLSDWRRAQMSIVGETISPYSDEEIEQDVEDYRRRFLESLKTVD